MDVAALLGKRSLHFVHGKLSWKVSRRLGVRSLRMLLVVSQGAKVDSLGMASAAAAAAAAAAASRKNGGKDGENMAGVEAESFGQSESLTRRLRHILELYPEGSSIVHELVQNADDAGATTVRLVLDERRFGGRSLLGPRLAEWQGPAL